MSSIIRAIIKPELLIWARESAGLSIEVAAKKVGVKQDRLNKWEKGELQPTIKQLRTLGKIYKRPLAVFYLPKPPKKFQPPREFRQFPGTGIYEYSPNLRFEIRRAEDRRQIALDLYQLLGESPSEINISIELSDKPENKASEIRELLGISYETQVNLRYYYEAFNHWKKVLEDSGILIFQAPNIDLNEMRAFSISDSPLPVIVLNVKDSPSARIFSLLHEFIHILLKKGGLCDLEEEGLPSPEEQKIEVFCNRVAGAILIPEEKLSSEKIVLEKGYYAEWEDAEIKQLANRYKVSREVALRRLLIAGHITIEFYRQKREEYRKEFEKAPEKKEGFPLPYYKKAIIRAGNHFIRLVLNSYYQEKITSSDVSGFLDVKLKHMSDIEMEVIGQSIIF